MTLRTGFGPHGVQDPPCLERMRVHFIMGALVGLGAGAAVFTLSELTSSKDLPESIQLQKRPVTAKAIFAAKSLRVVKKTAGLSLFFGLFMLAGSAIKCT